MAGMQWKDTKKAFRPTAGLTSYEKRVKERVLMAQMKAKEKEMKEEKEEERQVRKLIVTLLRSLFQKSRLTYDLETHPSYQGEANEKGGKGEIRAAGSEDAQEACRALEAQGKA